MLGRRLAQTTRIVLVDARWPFVRRARSHPLGGCPVQGLDHQGHACDPPPVAVVGVDRDFDTGGRIARVRKLVAVGRGYELDRRRIFIGRRVERGTAAVEKTRPFQLRAPPEYGMSDARSRSICATGELVVRSGSQRCGGMERSRLCRLTSRRLCTSAHTWAGVPRAVRTSLADSRTESRALSSLLEIVAW